jgi:hypothetical protein
MGSFKFTHNHGDLWHNSGRHDVPLEDVGVSGQRFDAFLDASAAGVVQTDDGCADKHGLIHYLEKKKYNLILKLSDPALMYHKGPVFLGGF